MNPISHFKMPFVLFIVCLVLIAGCNTSPDSGSAGTMAVAAKYTGPTNKDVYEVFNTGNFAKLDSIIAKDGIDHTSMGDIHGLDSIKASIKGFREAFPDIKMEAMEEAIQGDMIFTRCHFTGTNTGMMNGMPATNKKVDMIGVDVVKVKDGKLYEHWGYNDNLEFFKQLGINPMAPAPKK